MSQKPIQVEVQFKVPGDSEDTRVAFFGERSKLLSDPHKLQQLLEIMGLPEGASAKILYTTDDVVVR
ncbi:hypothetical protein [Burkholderia cenocepacia]|uniref:hypothetical protein n=1 Tax=Burkholderia cenocepacia TaxID=95486 RepID=UPI00158B82D5|nr:hypothetical protein [Burkholderia cenocepacia]